MANLFMVSKIFCLLLLVNTLATSARLLDEVVTTPEDAPDASDPVVPPEADDTSVAAPAVTPTATLPSGQIPVNNVAPVVPTEPLAPEPITTPVATPLIGVGVAATSTPPVTTPVAGGSVVPTESLAPEPVKTPVATPLTGGGVATSTTTSPITTPTTNPVTTPGGGAGAAVGGEHALSFFMHDILGGSNPSGRVVTGIVANSDANNLPFSKLNNQQLFPINGGVPLNTINNVINNNNYPSLVGLNGNTFTQSNGNNVVNNNNNQAFVTAGQLPQGLTLQQLMFGSVTVVDNEITEGHELGSAVLGKAQGFYMVSSSDGSSHTLALTAMFHGGGGEHHEIEDTISFFGIHRTATSISHIAIVGGTGRYENANGYATIETLPHEDQHTTDGLQTITHFTLYLTP